MKLYKLEIFKINVKILKKIKELKKIIWHFLYFIIISIKKIKGR